MSYDPKIYSEVRQRFAEKEQRARLEAEQREIEVRSEIPKLIEIDKQLQSTGFRIMSLLKTESRLTPEERVAAIRKENEGLLAEKERLMAAAGFPADYCEPKFECPVCRDAGFKDDRTMCGCLRKALLIASAEQSGIGYLLKKQSFKNFDLSFYEDKVKIAKTVSICREFADKLQGNLLLMGGTGLGKTHLSSAIVGQALKNGRYALYVTAAELLRDYEHEQFLRGRGDESPDRTEKYRECELLVIDDLGSEMTTQFSMAALYTILNDRISRGAATLVSTNLGPAELRERYIDRIASRLLGEFTVRTFEGKDVRQQKKEIPFQQ